ncbi:unnamed protein product [Ostreobium quekettii]|uniref:Uncharacterized protein n=1 Tax=Ostreobium quekettii TaxID=121088 RepID=A0A8S1J600_9CHLO|nr:unnamed protein product [Ostreobium quekettii]
MDHMDQTSDHMDRIKPGAGITLPNLTACRKPEIKSLNASSSALSPTITMGSGIVSGLRYAQSGRALLQLSGNAFCCTSGHTFSSLFRVAHEGGYQMGGDNGGKKLTCDDGVVEDILLGCFAE